MEFINQDNLGDNETYSIYKYYAENTISNHLNDIVENKKFTIITMDHSHNSWMYSDSQITKICNKIKNMLLS